MKKYINQSLNKPLRNPILRLAKVSKSFPDNGGKNFVVLDKIDMSVYGGEFICILGPSGCGKTVLLYLIAGFLFTENGKVLIKGEEAGGPDAKRVLMFQDYVLLPWKTVYENVLFSLTKQKLSKKQKHKRVEKYLNLVGLEKFKNWYPHRLSGGMQQRVALARSLVVNPDILLMDEPFAALDSQFRKYLREQLVTIWQKTKTTIIFVTHSVAEAIYLADRIFVLTSQPAKIKREYKIDIKRPRDMTSISFAEIRKSVENDTKEEFEKIKEKQYIKSNCEKGISINL
ncbi:MAG: ABC transporter ATP-binding protein [bacterium]